MTRIVYSRRVAAPGRALVDMDKVAASCNKAPALSHPGEYLSGEDELEGKPC
ncbi:MULTISPECIES: hypothetical protein [unclassified Halomonas]|uniref:hypothetical protein n=1 Tax=unclassified Halomonas TaxID=2609666 RepID=UPI0020A09B93|nr:MULTISPECIES: hypothetical protein [unclassified Halomonas]MCP1313713.1 hypothetical protein [Halomonas sp. 707D7]MCP1327859.1 hypothetical protein [Halomonas sp. 707D4]